MKMSKWLFTDRTQRVLPSHKPISDRPALPHRNMRLHCHSFLVSTKTMIVRQLVRICPVKIRPGHRGKAAAVAQEVAGSFPQHVTGLQMRRADDFFLHRRRNYRHRSAIMWRQLHTPLQQAINNTRLRPVLS